MSRFKLLCCITLSLSMVWPVVAADQTNCAEETAAVEKGVDGFYSALNAMFTGDATPMKQVWSHAEDVTYMGPDGKFEIGWKQVGPIWDKQAERKLGGKVTAENLKLVVGHDLAVAHNFEVGENLDSDGKPIQVQFARQVSFAKRVVPGK